MTHIQQAIDALAIVQHLWLCEDEGISSGQPSKEEYLRARDIVDQAIAAIRSPAPMNMEAMAREFLHSRDMLALDDHGFPRQEDYEGEEYTKLLVAFGRHVEAQRQATSSNTEANGN